MLSDLIFVLKHIKAIIEEYGLPALYSQYATTLQQIASASTPDLQKNLRSLRDKIKEAHERLEPIGWTYNQDKYFKQFGAEKSLGAEGWARFLAALSENSANMPGAVEQINILSNEITQLLNNANNILNSLGPIATELEVDKDKSVVQIVFDEDVKIDTFIDMAKESDEWKDIIRAFSLFAKEAPENTKIIASSKGSPYTVWLLTARFVGETICETIKPFVGLYKEILTAKEKALTLEDMKMEIDGKKFELFETIDAYESKKIMDIVENIGKIRSNNHLTEAEKNEAIAALRIAGPKLYEFITKGGKVDVSKEDGNHKAFSNFQLETSYHEAEKLNSRVQKLLASREAKKEEEKKVSKKTEEKPTEEKPDS